MKKRRLVLVAFLICATLIAGVGYALTTQTLTITGSASTTATDIDVHFSSATIKQQSPGGGATPGAAGTGVKDITFTAAGLKEKDDVVIATYTIVNESDYPVTLAVPTISVVDSTNFEVTTTFGDTEVTLDAAGGANDELTFDVTVTLKNTPNTVAGLKSDFTITIHATGK
jgi:hypothetical protein